jgi:NAD(P)-dependent dehydrogenase (short-subunit alcohol dehydrogenase family)
MIERKVAIITGSGTGVGAATALLLSKQGYRGPSISVGLPSRRR